MKLESLELENIRSYADAAVRFGDGVTLLEGDVGSGKSTILYAIEFALFGLGDLKAGHMLRHGADKGKVKLTLEAGGKKIAIQRNLERKKETTRQLPGWIEEDGFRTEYSPEEMKQRVLQLLKFRENPSAKATSWIFRYAVFTPQEQMKEILTLRAEERLQTLRKAFGVEEYRNAQENTALLLRSIREETRAIEGELKDLPEWLAKKESLEKEKQDIETLLEGQGRTIEAASKELEQAEQTLAEAREHYMQLEKIGAELPLLKKRRDETAHDISSAEADLANTAERQARLTNEEQALQKTIQPVPEDAEKAWENAETRLRALQTELGAAEQKAREYAQLQSGSCPTCGQKLSEDLHGRIQHAKSELAEKMKEYEAASLREKEARKARETLQKQRLTVQRIADIRQQKADFALRLEQQKERLAKLAEAAKETETEWAEKQAVFSHYSEAKQKLDAREKEKREKQALQQKALEKKASLETRKQQNEKLLAETTERVAKKEAVQKVLAAVKEKARWLDEHFLPSVQNIEQHVLRRINDDFNSLFGKWFVKLLETQDLEAEVDESFTPAIRQQGFEQDYTALSGGEKSALALAYRLALNTLVRQTTPSLKENLLILDEPTDGFSKEQLGRMRDVLEETGAKQVIIVSHERELEGFCDKVLTVEKQHGKSTIRTA